MLGGSLCSFKSLLIHCSSAVTFDVMDIIYLPVYETTKPIAIIYNKLSIFEVHIYNHHPLGRRVNHVQEDDAKHGSFHHVNYY